MNKAIKNDFFIVSDFIKILLNERNMCHPKLRSYLGLLASSIYAAAEKYIDMPCEYTYIQIGKLIEFNRGYLSAVVGWTDAELSILLTTAINESDHFGGMYHDVLTDEHKRQYLAEFGIQLNQFLDDIADDIHNLNH